MQQFTKSQKKHLRKMVEIAYKRHLSKALKELQGQFTKWKEGAIDVWELNQEIHEYHNGRSRDLYKMTEWQNLILRWHLPLTMIS